MTKNWLILAIIGFVYQQSLFVKADQIWDTISKLNLNPFDEKYTLLDNFFMLFPQFLPNHNPDNGPHAIDRDHLVVEDFRLSF